MNDELFERTRTGGPGRRGDEVRIVIELLKFVLRHSKFVIQKVFDHGLSGQNQSGSPKQNWVR